MKANVLFFDKKPVRETPWTKKLWIYDLRTNTHFKAGLDISWLKDESLEASDNLPDPDVIAQEIVEDLEAALEQFREIVGDLGPEGSSKGK